MDGGDCYVTSAQDGADDERGALRIAVEGDGECRVVCKAQGIPESLSLFLFQLLPPVSNTHWEGILAKKPEKLPTKKQDKHYQ